MVELKFKIRGLIMYKVVWYETAAGLNVRCSWQFNSLAEAYEAMLERQAKGYITEIVRSVK